ncbi:hypothetical protein [Geodermatophilus poikilotrophus]|uniref:hypothetical protein n=1 Tax=Geodermatophilus poikilotrophus TaxID=1333667 RepID=UPI000AEE3FB9|nr:hypothetical protein [Geodermatophilus poikilotrophus]
MSHRTGAAMPALTPEEERDYLRRQVLTSRNVRGGRFVDLLLGGLNYQVEHTSSRACRGPTCGAPSDW